MRASAAIIVLALVVAGCGDQPEADVATTMVVQPSTTTAPPSTTATSVDAAELSEGLPRSARYGFLEVTINRATLGAIEPNTFLRDDQVPSTSRFLFLTVDVANLSEEGDAANWPPTPYGINVRGEPGEAPQMLEGRPHIGLPALNSAEAVMAFEVPEDVAFEDIEFTLAEQDRIPLTIPLTGQSSPPSEPIDVEAPASGPAVGAAHGCNQQLEVEVLEANVSVDLLDTESYPTQYGSRRALVGDRFLTLVTRVHNHGGSRCGGGGTNIDGSLVRLYVDGVPRAPISWLNTTIAVDAATDLSWHFNYPVDAGELEILFGSEDAEPLWIPVDVTAAADS